MPDRPTQVVLLHAVRAFAAGVTTGPRARGWSVASLVPQIGVPLRAMHSDIAHPWSVRELRREIAFGVAFKRVTGVSPGGYRLRAATHRSTPARAS